MEQRGELLFSVPYLCQYTNSSVVVILVEYPSGGLIESGGLIVENHSDEFAMSNIAAGGTDNDHRSRFIVTPRIPDEQATRLPITFHVNPCAPGTYRRSIREGTFQPGRFERYVPVRAMQQREDLLVTVPYLCQYNNCSVIVVLFEHPSQSLLYSDCDLTIPGHEVRTLGGELGGTHEHRFRFAVTPPIPDEQAAHVPMAFQIDPGKPPQFPGFQPIHVTPIAPTTIRFHSGDAGR